jgi:hypothetical protein
MLFTQLWRQNWLMKIQGFPQWYPVTQYSPSVFDAIVNQTMVSLYSATWFKYDSMTPRACSSGEESLVVWIQMSLSQLLSNLSPTASSLTVPTLHTRLTVLALSSPRLSLSHTATHPWTRLWRRRCEITPILSPRRLLQRAEFDSRSCVPQLRIV